MESSTESKYLTSAEKLQLINEIIKNIKLPAKIFIPDDKFYEFHEINNFIDQTDKILKEWLNLDNKSVKYQFDNLQTFVVEKQAKEWIISINKSYSEYPFIISAIIAFCLCKIKILDSTDKFKVKEIEDLDEFVSLASIEFGLGVIILNGYGAKTAFWPRTISYFNRLIANPNGSQMLFKVHFRQYADWFESYAQRNNLPKSSWGSYLLPTAWNFINKISGNKKNKQRFKVAYVTAETRRRLIRKIKITLIFILTASLILIGWLWLHNRPAKFSPEQLDLYETAEIYKNKYQICISQNEFNKQNTTTKDLFVENRQAADAQRCESYRLKNNELISELQDGLN